MTFIIQKKKCSAFNLNLMMLILCYHQKPVANETISRFIVNDKNKILYCFVPKTGTTTTKHVFYNLEHGTNTTTLFLGSKHLKFLSEYTDNEILRRLETYIKFIVVRDPLER